MFNVYKNQLSRQTGSRNLKGPKTLPTIWYTYMTLMTKYKISASYRYPISWEVFLDPSDSYFLFADFVDFYTHWSYMLYMPILVAFLSRQTGSRNLKGPKTLPTIWYTYMTLMTKYKISAINSYWEKCEEKYLGRTDRGKTVYIRLVNLYFPEFTNLFWCLYLSLVSLLI
jgi:hypothetical protein